MKGGPDIVWNSADFPDDTIVEAGVAYQPDGVSYIRLPSGEWQQQPPERGLTRLVRDTIQNEINGTFSAIDLYNYLGLTQQQRPFCRVVLGRLCEDGIIERVRAGVYRKIERPQGLDLSESSQPRVPLQFPLELEKVFSLREGNIMVLAGTPNAGKTCFALDFIRLNQEKYDCIYLCKEMEAPELRERLTQFEGYYPNIKWSFKPYKIKSDYGFLDGIQRDKLNVLDYLSPPPGEFFKIAQQLEQIQSRLGKGIALVCIQKTKGQELGRGASFGLELPRVYLSLDRGKLSIVKAKHPEGNLDPEKVYYTFRIEQGCKFTDVRRHIKD